MAAAALAAVVTSIEGLHAVPWEVVASDQCSGSFRLCRKGDISDMRPTSDNVTHSPTSLLLLARISPCG